MALMHAYLFDSFILVSTFDSIRDLVNETVGFQVWPAYWRFLAFKPILRPEGMPEVDEDGMKAICPMQPLLEHNNTPALEVLLLNRNPVWPRTHRRWREQERERGQRLAQLKAKTAKDQRERERVKREKAEEARKAEARSAAAEEKVSEARANEEQACSEQ